MQKQQLEKLMEARNSKTFSMQEKIAEKAKLESMGLSTQEVENVQNNFIKDHSYYFTEFNIDGKEPDAIIFDTQHSGHKAVFYEKPKNIENQAILKYSKGQKVKISETIQIPMHVDIYQHQTIELENNSNLMIRIGSKDDALKQVQDIYKNGNIPVAEQTFMKFCPNIGQLQAKQEAQSQKEKTEVKPAVSHSVGHHEIDKTAPVEGFSIKNIKIGERYEGYIKLSYNYGMFVTVKGVEGLLHKNLVVAPAGVERKKYYNIGDKIKVKATEFKEVNGEQKVVWSQK